MRSRRWNARDGAPSSGAASDRAARNRAGLVRVCDLRTASEPAALGVRRALVFSEQATAGIRAHLLVSRIPTARQCARVARHQRLDRRPDSGAFARGPRGLRPGTAEASLAQRDPAAFPAATGGA